MAWSTSFACTPGPGPDAGHVPGSDVDIDPTRRKEITFGGVGARPGEGDVTGPPARAASGGGPVRALTSRDEDDLAARVAGVPNAIDGAPGMVIGLAS